MKTLFIDWMFHFANNPRIIIVVDALPDDSSRVWKKVDDVYYSILDGLYQMFTWDSASGNNGGYGGRSFELPMVDGTVATLQGPWSGNSAYLAEKTGIETIEVSLQIKDGLQHAGYYLDRAYVRQELTKQGLYLVPADYGEGFYAVSTHPDRIEKPEPPVVPFDESVFNLDEYQNEDCLGPFPDGDPRANLAPDDPYFDFANDPDEDEDEDDYDPNEGETVDQYPGESYYRDFYHETEPGSGNHWSDEQPR